MYCPLLTESSLLRTMDAIQQQQQHQQQSTAGSSAGSSATREE